MNGKKIGAKALKEGASVFERIKNIIPYFLAMIPCSIAIVRAGCSALTWDEAFTYMFYALPLSENPSVDLLIKISKTCHLNNHWINTVLIAFFTSLLKVKYSEFIVRLPVLIFAALFYLFSARCVVKKTISWLEFILLLFSYYLNEFFGLARGYGICISLVFVSLIFFREFISNFSINKFWISFYLLTLSTYANSVSLLIVFAVGTVTVIDLMRKHMFIEFVRKSLVHLLICGESLLYILLFHMRASGAGMPVYSVDKVDFLFYVKQYFFLTTYHINFSNAFFLFVAITFVIVTIISLFFSDFNRFEFVLLFFIHLLLLLVMPFVFKRGGFLFRTLIPSYPLFVFCVGTVMKNIETLLVKRCRYVFYGVKSLLFVFCCLLFVVFIKRIDVMHTRDWFDNYKIKGLVMNEMTENKNDANPCWEFYERQKQNMER